MPDPFVRADVRAFLDFLAAAPGPKMHELDPAGARAQMLALGGLADAPIGELARIEMLSAPGPAGEIPIRLFDARATRAPGPAIVFYHGGGFVIGDLDTHAAFCAEMARATDLPVLSVDYRLAPEAKWPAAPDDAEAATRWAAEASLGFGVTGLVLAGDSAGGNLALVTAMALRDEPAAVPVIAQCLFYPASDMRRDDPSATEFAEGYLLTREGLAWFGGHYGADVAHHRSSPMAGALAGLPPAVVVTASLDPLRDQGRALAAALIETGTPVIYREARGNIHGFVTLRQAIPSSRGDVAGALAALRALVTEAEGERVMAQAASGAAA